MTVGICAPYLRNAGTDEEPDWVINSPTWDGLTLGGSLSAWILRRPKAHQTDVRRASAMHRARGHGITITTKRTTKDREALLQASARTRNLVYHLPIRRAPNYYVPIRRPVRNIGDLALSFQHPSSEERSMLEKDSSLPYARTALRHLTHTTTAAWQSTRRVS